MSETSTLIARLEDQGCDRMPFTDDHKHCICRLTNEAAREITSLRAQLDEAKERAHYATGVAETNIKRANEAADEARRKAIEECAAVVIAMREGFLSPEYATGQPLSSMNERIACSMILNNLTALLSESKT